MKNKSKVLSVPKKKRTKSLIQTTVGSEQVENPQPNWKTVNLNKRPNDKEPKRPRSSPLQANDFQEFQSPAAYSRLVDNLQQNIENVPVRQLKKKAKSVR